ncbi:MAG TPA: hypothetical protein VMW48_07740 [Vicinamibacterales bacterium]|nr:hypothetical protein [Vicinamibacterales bacterium]
MAWLILIAGVVGLLVAAFGFVAMTVGAIRRRQYADILVAVLVVILVVSLLIAYGDRLLR